MDGQTIELADASGTSTPATMSCPKCGVQQPEAAECVGCGVFVAKFVESARRAQEARLIQASVAERHAAYQMTDEQDGDDDDDGFFAPEKKGIENGMAGGIAMMTIAVVWFGAGWLAGVIFFYPPILFLIGAFALVKGMVTGNVGA
jgi:hypothetical protein